MIQHLIIGLLFTGALFYLGRLAYRAFTSKNCASGCGKCSAVDFNQIEQKIRKKESISV